jgi:signal transduction histidine kinase
MEKLIEFNFFFPTDFPDDHIDPERTISFIIYLDSTDTIVQYVSQFETSEEFLRGAIDSVDSTSGDVEYDSYYWRYQVVEYQGIQKYVFLDITSEHQLLNNMLIRFIIIFIVSAGLVTLLSYFLSNRSIKPIKLAFNKQKQFVSDASHELKTPLAVINTNVDVLLNKSNSKEDKKWLSYIKSEVERMDKLTKNLLYLAKMSEDQNAHLMSTSIDLSSITQMVVLGFEALAYERKIDFQYDIQENIHALFIDEQYRQVLSILIDNAIKYSNQGGLVSIVLKKQNSSIILEVENTGAGIKEEDLPYIFDRFYKGDKSRQNQHNSYGLGLSIAKSIIDNHGGKITCQSIENEFTKFTLKL